MAQTEALLPGPSNLTPERIYEWPTYQPFYDSFILFLTKCTYLPTGHRGTHLLCRTVTVPEIAEAG